MNKQDFLNAEVVKLSDIRPGDQLIAYAWFLWSETEEDAPGFCIEPWACVEVKVYGPLDELYVDCKCGKHFLEGQVDFNDNVTLVGLRRL